MSAGCRSYQRGRWMLLAVPFQLKSMEMTEESDSEFYLPNRLQPGSSEW